MSTVTFKQNTTPRMTTTKSYDFLIRLTSAPVHRLGGTSTTFILISLCFLLPIACSKARREVVCWPANITKRSPTDLAINDADQIAALRVANSTNDAMAALLKNDLRFIVDAPSVGRIQGVPYDNLVNSLRSIHGCKIIAFRAMHLIPLTPLLGVCSAN